MKMASLFDPFTGKETIDEKTKALFLVSSAYCNMIRKMVVGITSDHRITVFFLPASHPELAFTDGKRVMINTLHRLFSTQPIEKVTEYCLALAVHESLHPLYSCFQCVEDAARQRPNENDNTVFVRKQVFNILEDARIERIGSFKFPGVSYAIESLNEYLYSLEQDFSNAKDIEIMMKWILDFVSVGKNRSELTGDMGLLFDRIKPLALKAKYSDTCSGCYFYTKKIMRLLQNLIPEQDPLDRQNQKPDTSQGNDTDVDAKTGQTVPGTAQSGGNCAGQGNGKANGGQGSDSQGQSVSGGQQPGQPGSPSGAPGGAGGSGAAELADKLNQALNNSYNEHVKDIADDAEDSKTASSISADSTPEYKVLPVYGSHTEMDEYCKIKSDVAAITNHLKTGLKNIINYNVDEMNRYLHVGRIDAKSLSRMPSGAICAKRIEKSDEADLNITVLVDLSGSMSGENLDNSIKACTVLQEVSMALKIPITILGFQDGGRNHVQIFHFTNRELKGRYTHTGVVKMNASGGTPLNPALKYLPRLLRRQKEEDKLVIVITDGAPNSPPEECAASVKQIEKYAKVYGLAIGGGRESLMKIFGSNCIVVDVLEKMPRELCRIIEKNMLRR